MWQGSYVPAILIEHSSTSQEAVGFAAGSAPPQAGVLLCEQEKEIEKIYQNIKNIIYKLYNTYNFQCSNKNQDNILFEQ